MKMIILAAGEGKRLRPLTKDKPKCMVKYQEKEIISHILHVTKPLINNIAIVSGYKSKVLKNFLKNEKIHFYENKEYAKTNMLYTLFCAREYMDDDIIISYADIVYKKEILEKLIASQEDFSVVVDRKWRELWQQRMENPLDDAETLKIKNDKIQEIGKKPKSYDDIEGQYMGFIKIKKQFLPKVLNFYENLDKNALYDEQDFKNMYMTSFIQALIDKFDCVSPVFVDGGWVEVDSKSDLKIKVI